MSKTMNLINKTLFTLVFAFAATASAQSVSVQGRQGGYTVQKFASATIQMDLPLLGWKNGFNLTAYAQKPKNHGGSVDNVLQTLSNDNLSYVELRIHSDVRAFATYNRFGSAIKKNRSKLSSPKGEVDQLINAVDRKGSSRMDSIKVYFEKSSDTFFVNLDGDLTEISSSPAYFAKLLEMFNDNRAKFRIVGLQ